MTEWSIEHGVEIIDLSEDSEEGNDQVTVFAENGKKRIIEALQTVMWTELCDPDTQEGEKFTKRFIYTVWKLWKLTLRHFLTNIS